MNTFPLENKLILLTGGLGGYGLAISRLALKRGANLRLCDLHHESEAEALLRSELPAYVDTKQRVQYSRCDVSNEDEFEALFKACILEHGHSPDVLINCAAIIDEGNWKRVYDVNLKAAHHGIELAFKYMATKSPSGEGGGSSKRNACNADDGVVINVSDIFGLTCKLPLMKILPAYTASKHAVTSLTRCFGSEYWYNRTGVKVIAVTPHLMDTDFFFKSRDAAQHTDPQTQSVLAEFLESHKPLEPEEAALKLINVLNAATGSVWYLSPNQLQPANIPDYVLPKIHMNKVAPKTFGVFGINYGMGTKQKPL